MARSIVVLVALAAASCNRSSPEAVRADAGRLSSAFDRHRGDYLRTVQKENELVSETLKWLNTGLEWESRGAAAMQAVRSGEKYSRTHLAYKIIHDDLLSLEVDSPRIREAHRAILAHLHKRSLALQHVAALHYGAARNGFSTTPIGRIPRELNELKSIANTHRRIEDEVALILEAIEPARVRSRPTP